MGLLKYIAILVVIFNLTINFVQSDEFEMDDQHMHPSLVDEQIDDNPNTGRSVLHPEELEINYWKTNAQDYLREILEANSFDTPKRAKNVILFLGDGMSLATVAATRMYLGGEEKSLSFEKFPHFGLSKTYCVDRQVADSACTSTAYLNGVKANYGTMGLNANVQRRDCKGQNKVESHTDSIAKWAQTSCKASGLVTTSRVTHASPGGLYAHIADRNWENDREVERSRCDPNETIDIARQLIENDVAKNLKVVFGGGRAEFRSNTTTDEENLKGLRGDNKDLIKEWIASRSKQGKSEYIFDKKGLNNIKNDTEYLLGLFSDDHCEYNIDIENNNLGETKPKLSEMTVAAIKFLQKEKNGYFLFVESARIDMAHHENWARIALDETKEFSKTVQLAREMTNLNDTLIVVTSDHGHTMTYNGYPRRGHDVLGLSGMTGSDKLPYSTLSYANGLGYYETYEESGARANLSKTDFKNPRLRYIATVPLQAETHGGEDVGIYASGPQSELFVGNYEQSNIPMLMAYAAKIGPYAEKDEAVCHSENSASALVIAVIPIILAVLLNIAV